MGLTDILRQIAGPLGSLFGLGKGPATSPPEGQPVQPPTPQPKPVDPVQNAGEPPAVTPEPPPVQPAADRFGTFIIPDVYPPDLDDPRTPELDLPHFEVLPGLVAMDKEVIGCYVKASEGLGWGPKNEDWFRRAWRRMAEVRAARKAGSEFRRGAYHFLRFQLDGARQADYCCDLIESAGGRTDEDLMLWVDVEEGGQGTWANDPQTGVHRKLEVIGQTLPAERARLAKEITACTTAFVARVKARYPGIRVGVYGRGVFRDLRMTGCLFGADAACDPAYTSKLIPMDQYGIPLDKIIEWQCCGDGEVYVPGYPSVLPGWGKTDYSVCLVNGKTYVSLNEVVGRIKDR